MSTEPNQGPNPTPPKRPRPGKPVNDGFVVYDVDGYAALTPEQKLWPVVGGYPLRVIKPRGVLLDRPPADPPPPAPEG